MESQKESTTTKRLSPEDRRLARERRRKREARRKAKVAETIHKVLKVVTFNDLDGDQLLAYKGIHEWWNTSQECGGVPQPLIIGGYAGTGKSTLLSIALPMLKNLDGSDVRVSYCAYTGKAANGLINKGLEASTIHNLIYDVDEERSDEHGVEFTLKDSSEVECELIVVDEASMVPDGMRKDMESLGIPIMYTGDHGQLPPVAGIGNIMSAPHLTLEEIHRQAEDSGIIKIATMVRKGKTVSNGKYGINLDAHKVSVKERENTNLLANADVVICYTNKSKEEYNRRIREYKGFSGIIPMVGEKLICVKNNKLTQMFNGLSVTITSIIEEEDAYVIDCIDDAGNERNKLNVSKFYFEGHDHPKIRGQTMLDLFEFAYAITGHKAQGSQWNNVVVIEELMFKQKLAYKRKWMYTVLTRAINRITWVSRFH